MPAAEWAAAAVRQPGAEAEGEASRQTTSSHKPGVRPTPIPKCKSTSPARAKVVRLAEQEEQDRPVAAREPPEEEVPRDRPQVDRPQAAPLRATRPHLRLARKAPIRRPPPAKPKRSSNSSREVARPQEAEKPKVLPLAGAASATTKG